MHVVPLLPDGGSIVLCNLDILPEPGLWFLIPDSILIYSARGSLYLMEVLSSYVFLTPSLNQDYGTLSYVLFCSLVHVAHCTVPDGGSVVLCLLDFFPEPGLWFLIPDSISL